MNSSFVIITKKLSQWLHTVYYTNDSDLFSLTIVLNF